MAIHNLSEFDVFYISYDEPNCEQNYADLVNMDNNANTFTLPSATIGPLVLE